MHSDARIRDDANAEMRATSEPSGWDGPAWCAHEQAEANRARQFLPFAALDGLEDLMSEEEALEAEADVDAHQIVL